MHAYYNRPFWRAPFDPNPVMRLHRLGVIVSIPFAVRVAGAQSDAGRNIPVRTVADAIATATETFGAILGVRQLSDGRVFVNDAARRKLLLFEPALDRFTVIADTAAGATNDYVTSPAPIIRYLGDSTFFAPFTLRALLVLDSKGVVARVAALPQVGDWLFIIGSRTAVDERGNLIYRASVDRGNPFVSAFTNDLLITQAPDSAPIVRADCERRQVDTLAFVRIPTQQRVERTYTNGRVSHVTVQVSPVSWVDDWAVMSDGTLAIVRGREYRVEWIGANGAVTDSPKLPFDWRRMTDEDKQRIADSVVKELTNILDRSRASAAARGGGRAGRGAGRGDGGGGGGVLLPNQAGGISLTIPRDATVVASPLAGMPDYYPPIRAGTVMADFDNNLWILPATSARSTRGGIVYDVVNRKGELFERVEMPPSRSVAGFGPNGALYLMWRDSTLAWHLEKTRIAR